MPPAFELYFRDSRKLNAFIKTCEALSVQSDTALFKVKSRGVYILLTDFESFSCSEARMTEEIQSFFKIYCKEFTAKILLDSLSNILRQILKNKRHALVWGEMPTSDQTSPPLLQVKELSPQKKKIMGQYTVESTEHRARVYHVISTKQFRQKSKEYVQFRLVNQEFNKLITMQAILSGSNGGVGVLRATPSQTKTGEPRLLIRFYIENQSGGYGFTTIHTYPGSDVVPVIRMPSSVVETRYLVTFLKRAQNLFTVPSDYVTLYVSEKGILVQTDTKDHHSVVLCIADISNIDLGSYV